MCLCGCAPEASVGNLKKQRIGYEFANCYGINIKIKIVNKKENKPRTKTENI